MATRGTRQEQDLLKWASRNKLTEETLAALKAEGFDSLEMIHLLKPEIVTEIFEKKNLLNAAQCLALHKALQSLSFATRSSSSKVATPSRAPGTTTPRKPDGSRGIGHAHTPRPRSALSQLKLTDSAKPRGPCVSTGGPDLTVPAEGGASAAEDTDNDQQKLEELTNWASSHELSAATVPILKKLGFNTLSKLKHLARAYVEKYILEKNLLPLADCLVLMNLEELLPRPEVSVTLSSVAVEEECLRFLLLGKTGSGKSTTGNTILGKTVFDCSTVSMSSLTTKCDLKRGKNNGQKIEIMDCPGLYDTSRSLEETGTTVIQAVGAMHPGPDVILYIIRMGRFTKEDFDCYTRFQALFDANFTKHTIVLITWTDTLEQVMKTAPPDLRKVFYDCSHRILPFDNKAANLQIQVERLLEEARKLKQQNENTPYTCPKYAAIGEGLEAEVARRLAEAAQRDPQIKKITEDLQKANQEKDKVEKLMIELREQEKKLKAESDGNVANKQLEEVQLQLDEMTKKNDVFLEEISKLKAEQQNYQDQIRDRLKDGIARGDENGLINSLILVVGKVKDFVFSKLFTSIPIPPTTPIHDAAGETRVAKQ